MRFRTTILLLATFLTTSGQVIKDAAKFKSEIPTSADGRPGLFFNLTQQKVKQLSLENLQTGFDSLQLRIWYDYSLLTLRELLVISTEKTSWTASVYTFTVEWDASNLTESIKTKKYKNVNPKNGWASFIKKLFELQITTLPNMHDIPGLQDRWTDGITHNVEVGTENQYRYYGYHLPGKFQDKYWQAKKMVDILKLIEKEFGIKCNCE